MAYISYNKAWGSEFYGILAKRDLLQGWNNNQLKLKVSDTYKKDEKISTSIKAVNDENVIDKAYLDSKVSKTESHMSYFEKKITTNLNYSTTKNL